MAKRWYVVHTYSGYENKVRADLEHRIETFGLADTIVDIKIPVEQLTEIKEGGKRETKESKVFPGYVLVRMEMNDQAWSVVRNTPGVTGFVGINNKPSPLSRAEFDKIMHRNSVSAGSVPKRTATELEIGQSVKVTSGPFADFDGTISEIAADTGKAKVMLSVFGRETAVEIPIGQLATIQ
ncbi:MAG: transcription termination/antitermination factor NusG [Atopobiaceae bacterium]|nr:transcription termination/antitermination factor NusG [Atopobiaceae bacterium]